jgi:hypothetical protein
MRRTNIMFVATAAFALSVMTQDANSASINAVGAVEPVAGANLVQQVNSCHTSCRWGFYRAGNGKIDLGCHRNIWSCAFASPCDPRACRWLHRWNR